MIYLMGFVILQRSFELYLARNNAEKLILNGGKEYYPGHYPLFIALHGSWLAAILLFAPPDSCFIWPLFWVYVTLQFIRFWTLYSLGINWTTRIVRIPGSDLVRKGPYRFIKHPNYLVVALEIPTLPLIFGLWKVALVFSLLNFALLSYRIHCENKVLEL